MCTHFTAMKVKRVWSAVLAFFSGLMPPKESEGTCILHCVCVCRARLGAWLRCPCRRMHDINGCIAADVQAALYATDRWIAQYMSADGSDVFLPENQLHCMMMCACAVQPSTLDRLIATEKQSL